MSVFGVILVRIQSECGKIQTRMTPNSENQNQPLEDVLQNSSSAIALKQLKRSVQEFIQSTKGFQIHLGSVSETVFACVIFQFY